MPPRRSLAMIVLNLFLFSGTPLAQITGQVQPRTIHRQSSPSQQPQPQGEPTQTAQEKADFAGEPLLVEQLHGHARFEADGTGRREVSVRIRAQSEAGVQQLGQLAFGYNAANERLEIEYVRVRKADGSVVVAAPDAVQDLTAPIARDAPIYTDFRQKHVTVPGLRPGEALEYKVATIMETPLAPNQFWFEYEFERRVIVLDERLVVDVPRNRSVKLKTRPGLEPSVSEEGERRIYRWSGSHREREPDDESKKKKPRQLPRSPDVQLTTFESWAEVGRWYAGLERPRVVPTPELRAKAEELVRGRATDLEKVEALYDYVAKNFRYVSLSFGVGRYQPHAAQEVLRNQYGDCKDKHTLLASLLRAVGIRAYAALIHSQRKVDEAVPSPSQFDHVISAVALGKDQGLIWVDTTTEVAPFRMLSANLRGKKALLAVDADPEASGDTPPVGALAGPSGLLETPADPPFPSVQSVEIEAQVSELGKLSARVHYTLRGDNELALRQVFRRAPQNQWKQLGQLLALSDHLPSEVSELKPGDPAATRAPFELEYRIAKPNFLDWSNKKAQLGLPMPTMGLPDVEEDPEGREPVELGVPLDVTVRLRLELPARYAARAPVPVIVARDYAEYRSRYKVEGNLITAERLISFRLREVPAVRVRDVLAFTHAIRADESQSLSLVSTLAGPPAIPESAKADELYEAGLAALQNGNAKAAVELLKRVVEKEPTHEGGWDNLGRAYLLLLELEPAIRAFRRQIELNPYNEYAYNNLGLALWRQQKYAEAAESFRKQIEVTPLDRFAHANLGMLYCEWRKYSEAVPELEKAISLAPGNALLQVNLGRAYLNLGQAEKALAAFDKAVEIMPAAPTWNNVAYELAQHNAHLDRAQQYAESAIAATAAGLRNVQLDRLNRDDLSRVSELAAYWDTLGWVYFQRGDLDKAERYIHAAWLLNQHGEGGDHLGQIYEKRGQKRDAIRAYALALVADRPVPEARGHLVALVGGEKNLEPAMAQAREELPAVRTIKLGKLLAEQAEAEFFVVFAPASGASPAGGSTVEEVKFASGSEKLRRFADQLRWASYPVVFPDETPTKLVRRGLLSCSPATVECVFVLYPPCSVTPAN